MNFFGILFSGLTMENSLFFLSTTYYFIPISLIVTLVGMRTMNIVKMGKKIEEKISEKTSEDVMKWEDFQVFYNTLEGFDYPHKDKLLEFI